MTLQQFIDKKGIIDASAIIGVSDTAVREWLNGRKPRKWPVVKKLAELGIEGYFFSDKEQKCAKCEEIKTLDKFCYMKNGYNKRSYECRDCRNEDGSIYYDNNTEECNARSSAYYRTLKGAWSQFLSSSRGRKIPNKLTFEEFESFWQKDCYYCGDAIETIGLDRIDSALGYFVGNLVSCCFPCNAAKMDRTQEETILRCNRIAKLHPR